MTHEININWQPLPIAASEAPSVSGVYWLGGPFNVKYGNNISRVFYIGNAKTYQVDYYDPDGKRKMKCFKKKKDADAWCHRVEVSKQDGNYDEIFGRREENYITFDDLAKQYLENYVHQRSFRNKRRAIQYAMEAFGGKLLREITYMDIEIYRNKRKATPKKSGGVRTDATVNREMAALSQMFSKAVEWRKLKVSPLKQGSRLTYKENNQRQRYLLEEEIERLLNSCCAHLLPIVEIALHTGMRKGEILGLKWEQIRNGFIYLSETKSGKSRQIPLDARAAQVLKEQHIRNKWDSPYAMVGPDGKRLNDIKKSFSGACRRAGIINFRFHDLRHTFASHLVMKGANLKAVQRLLGHSNPTMVDRYSHLSPDHLRESINLLGDLPTGKEMVNILELDSRKVRAGEKM